MERKPLLISLGIAQRCLADEQFYSKMPEFLPLKSKLGMLKTAKVQGAGCSGCAQRRIQHRIGSDFMFAVSSLKPDAMGRLKAYLGVDNVLVNGVNPASKRFESKVL